MTWQQEMKKALMEFTVREGSLVSRDNGRGSYASWQDFTTIKGGRYLTTELSAHAAECGLDMKKSSYVESDWSEFQGTFAEPLWEDRKGTDVTVYCSCGRIAGRKFRYTGTVAELITAITRDE